MPWEIISGVLAKVKGEKSSSHTKDIEDPERVLAKAALHLVHRDRSKQSGDKFVCDTSEKKEELTVDR